MSDKLFTRIIIGITIVGLLTTTALVVYTIYLHNNCSIIAYIANGG